MGLCALWVGRRSDPHLSSVTMYDAWLRRYDLTSSVPSCIQFRILVPPCRSELEGMSIVDHDCQHDFFIMPQTSFALLECSRTSIKDGTRWGKRQKKKTSSLLFLVCPVKDSPLGDQSVASRSCYFDLIHSIFHWYSCCSDDLSHGVQWK